jgi:hypothetical protein
VGTLSLQDVVEGLNRVMSAGLMESIEWFFSLVSHLVPLIKELGLIVQHDKNDDGYLTKDEVIQLSESLLVG